MSVSRDFVQYIDSSYSVKVKPFFEKRDDFDNLEYYYLNGIDDEFFILSVFLSDKRVEGVGFYNLENMFMTSVINDLSTTDLNTISLNHFFEPNKEVRFFIHDKSDNPQFVSIVSSSETINVVNTSMYGLVKPTYVVKQHIPSSRNVRSLVVTHMGSYNGLTQATIFDRGFANGFFVNQFIGLNSDPDDGFQFYPEDSICFGIDDINILIVFLGNQAKYFEFDIETLIDDNIVKLSLSDGYRVSRVQPYAYSKTQWQFVIDKLLPNSNDIDFTFHVYIDWKVLPQIA